MILTVTISVLDGGDGSISGGRVERSRESGDRLLEDARERCGDGRVACMLAIMDVERENVQNVCCMRRCGECKSNT